MRNTQTTRPPRARTSRTNGVASLFPRQGQWTECEYLSVSEANRIVELSEGRLIIPDMPGTSHQRAVRQLLRRLCDYVEARGLGEVCMAPLPVCLWPGKIREPDLMFMSQEHADRIGERFWGAPDLVAEVISPRTESSSGTETTDRIAKLGEYAQAGVREYWLVDTVQSAIEVYVLREGEYHLLNRWTAGQVAQSQVLPGLETPVDAIVH